jgi:fructose-bisphosphate aldolase class I
MSRAGGALQDPALAAWHGRDENLDLGRQALSHRARCNGAASLGTYTEEMEKELAAAGSRAQRRG